MSLSGLGLSGQGMGLTDLDLLSTNRFISDDSDAGYGLTADMRRSLLRQHVEQTQRMPSAPPSSTLMATDILHTNRVDLYDTDGTTGKDGKEGRASSVVIKEKRTILSINSNQRNYFKFNQPLGTVEEYRPYITPSLFTSFTTYFNQALTANTNLSGYSGSDRSLIGGGPSSVSDINSGLIDLLETTPILNDPTANDLTSDALNGLNVLVMSSNATNPQQHWRPFYLVNGLIRRIKYLEQFPNDYIVRLDAHISNVKSIRLLSTEIPNTVNNVTERNNIIILRIRQVTGSVPIILNPSTCIFNFIFVKLDVGNYTVSELVQHIEDRLNAEVKAMSLKDYTDMFTVDYNENTGRIDIICNRSELEFHLKFYSVVLQSTAVLGSAGDIGIWQGPVTHFVNDLWYMLGFPWPYRLNSDGTDQYTQRLTNVLNFGVHDVFVSNDDSILKKTNTTFEAILTSSDRLVDSNPKSIVNIYRAYGYPSIEWRYIYLVIVGLPNIEHITSNNKVTVYTRRDLFAKVLLNVAAGQIAYNTFVSNPLIFPNMLDMINELHFQWVDEQGNLVDFNGANHSFTLEIIHYITQTGTVAYNSRLGAIDERSYPEYFASGNKSGNITLGDPSVP